MKKLLIITLIPFFLISCESDDDPKVEDLSLNFEASHATTPGGNDGSINLTVSGGTSPYTFAWSNGESTEDIENLSAGTYEVTVTDSRDEFITGSEEITEPDMLTKTENISMGAGYANEIYYSLKEGVVSTVNRTNWDLGFFTDARSSTITINDGQGLVLYTYTNGDVDDWETMDTTGMTWKALYNNIADTTWQNGAFDRNALGHPDYGWGIYSMTTHDVYGDSIYIVQYSDGAMKKIIIEKREAMTNSFIFKYADLDGSNEESVTLNCSDYPGKNMVYYSLTSNTIVDKEPLSADWDLVFTKYYDEAIPYIVTGVLTNENIITAELHETDTATHDYSSAQFSEVISTIGSDWKNFDMGTFSYSLEEDLVYFIKNREDRYYKIVFTAFSGSSSGDISFVITQY